MGWLHRPMTNWNWAVLFVLLMLPVAVSLADGGSQPSTIVARPVAYQVGNVELNRAGISGADPVTYDAAAITALEPVYCGKFQTVAVHGRFSVASATVLVTAIRYDLDGVIVGAQEFTLTGKATWNLGGLYLSNAIPVDTEACGAIRLAVAAPSSGNVDLWAGSY